MWDNAVKIDYNNIDLKGPNDLLVINNCHINIHSKHDFHELYMYYFDINDFHCLKI